MQNYINSRFPSLTYRDFGTYWFAQFISNIGSQMQIVALNWQVYVITHSALALGLIGLIRFISILLFSLIGGAVADAHNRKKVLFATQLTFAILSVILCILTFTNIITVNIIYLIAAVFMAFFAFDNPARNALIPNLVDKKHLTNAISLSAIAYDLSIVIGPAIAGILIAKVNLSFIYGLNAVSYVFVLISLMLMKNSGRAEGIAAPISFKGILEGLAFVKSNTMIWSTMLLDFLSTFFSGATALLPIFALKILSVGPVQLGLLYAAPSIGSVIAGLIIAHKHTIKKQGIALLSGICLYAIGTIIFGLSHIFILSFISLIVVGAGDGLSAIIRIAIRQLETPDYIRGRITSVNMIFFMGGPQLGDFEAGFIANYIGAPIAVITGGIGTLLIVTLMAFKIPLLRKYEHKQTLP